ncbi:hypothetical protein D3C81_840780 [compost metagenome]
MRGEEDGVEPFPRRSRRVHVDRRIGRAGGVVHHADAAMLMHYPGELVNRRNKAGHVGTGGECAYLDGSVPIAAQQEV